MIEQDIFKALKGAFSVNDLLKDIKLWSFSIEGVPKPFIIFREEDFGENTALIHLEIESEYKGIAEVSALKKEVRTVLSASPFECDNFHYVFKEENKNQKNNTLTFRVKRFKTGV